MGWGKEDWRDQLNAADLIRSRLFIVSYARPDCLNASMHLVKRRASIPDPKRLPREPVG